MKKLFSLLIIIFLLSFLLTACDNRSSSYPTMPTKTTTLTFINDTARHHIGDDYRGDFVGIEKPEGKEKTYNFALSGKPVSGTVQITVFDMDLIGADILINNALVMSMPPPDGDGTRSKEIPVASLLIGENTLTVRSRMEGTMYEDFEYKDLKLVVTIEVSS